MSLPVHVLGMGADGVESLSLKARRALQAASFVAGGSRHLTLAAPGNVETLAITNNLPALVERLRRRAAEERCVVLASGDPLFFGIGVYLRTHLGADALVVEPAVSSLQLAFARVPISWEGAAVASVHGRPLAPALIPLLGQPKIGLFTQDGMSPAAIAEFFIERGLDDYIVWVCEALGTADERVSKLDIRDVPGHRFGDLNFLVLLRGPQDGREAAEDHFGAIIPPDDRFARPEAGPVLLTHADVRAVVLNRFHDVPNGPLWDIGAGLGGVSIGLARQFRRVEVVAIERSPAQLEFLRENRRRFQAWNLRIAAGAAPDILANEAPPAGVFLGGSGGRLSAILDLVITRLLPRGSFVADFVGLENLTTTLERLRAAGWSPRVTQIHVSHSQELAGLTTLSPLRPVWVIRAVKPE
jgi:precorrin-6B C5,15-methyltransferase / cobalt-precorrin-6B C5,C15-methyltransferase